MTQVKHTCCCITNDKEGVVYFEKYCRKHDPKKGGGYTWIALQHFNLAKRKKNKR